MQWSHVFSLVCEVAMRVKVVAAEDLDPISSQTPISSFSFFGCYECIIVVNATMWRAIEKNHVLMPSHSLFLMLCFPISGMSSKLLLGFRGLPIVGQYGLVFMLAPCPSNSSGYLDVIS